MSIEVLVCGSQLQISKQEKDRDYLKSEGCKVVAVWTSIKYGLAYMMFLVY